MQTNKIQVSLTMTVVDNWTGETLTWAPLTHTADDRYMRPVTYDLAHDAATRVRMWDAEYPQSVKQELDQRTRWISVSLQATE